METQNSLNIKITGASLMKFALPTILSNVLMNLYSIADSLFVSNLLGTDALSALSIAAPILSIAISIGIMLATGGCALVALLMGEGKEQQARQNFSFFVWFSIAISVVFTLAGILFRRPLLTLMGADDALYAMCEAYAIPLLASMPVIMLGVFFQMALVAAGKPMLGFALSMIGGAMNIVLDYLLLAVFPLGITGAALASGLGYSVQAIVSLIYFAVNRKGSLYLVKPNCSLRMLGKACSNGMSEMVGTLAVSVTMIAMNVIMMELAGSAGVAASAIVLSMQTLLSAAYAGYCQGIAPVISYNYGKLDEPALKGIFRHALMTVGLLSVVTFAASFVLARPIATFYADGVTHVMDMAVKGTYVFAIAFLFMGFNLFASSLFTALNNGKISAILSLFRTLVFLIVPLLILPRLFGVNGIWLSLPTAEVLSLLLAIYYFVKMKGEYRYA